MLVLREKDKTNFSFLLKSSFNKLYKWLTGIEQLSLFIKLPSSIFSKVSQASNNLGPTTCSTNSTIFYLLDVHNSKHDDHIRYHISQILAITLFIAVIIIYFIYSDFLEILSFVFGFPDKFERFFSIPSHLSEKLIATTSFY